METLSIEIAARHPEAIEPHVAAALACARLTHRMFLLASLVGDDVVLDLMGAAQHPPHWAERAFRVRADRPETRDLDDHVEVLATGIARWAATTLRDRADRKRAEIARRVDDLSTSAHARMRNAAEIRSLRGDLAAATAETGLYGCMIERHGRNIIDILAWS